MKQNGTKNTKVVAKRKESVGYGGKYVDNKLGYIMVHFRPFAVWPGIASVVAGSE